MTAIAPTPDSQPSSPTPTLTVAPTPTPLPTPSYVPPPPADSLHVDGLAMVAVERLRQVVDPENPTAHPRQNRALYVLVDGDAVLLTDGPRTIGGRDYWQVFDPDQPGGIDMWSGTGQPLGWIPALRDGDTTLTPFQPPCPPTLPTTAAELQELRDFTSFACFGSHEIVLTGHVRCYYGHGDGVLNAPFFDSRRACTLDGVYMSGEPIFDLLPASGPPREIEGSYEVRGQFDHPDSRVDVRGSRSGPLLARLRAFRTPLQSHRVAGSSSLLPSRSCESFPLAPSTRNPLSCAMWLAHLK